ncbi:MAG: formiminoglutamase [Gammaproteobacteria bacterium]|jgi:formiminoglutamase
MQPDMTSWSGRIDPEPATLRWHQMVKPLADAEEAGIALIGFRSDEGVRRNHGRPGAYDGPVAIRKALAPLAYHSLLPIYDAGDVACDDGDLGAAQAALAEEVAAALGVGHLPLVMGGGHEMAFGSWSGLARHVGAVNDTPTIGIINFDAHFDLRDARFVISSGTPFAQIADSCEQRGWPFRYACLGVSRASNTTNLFSRADQLDVLYRLDRDMTATSLCSIQKDLSKFITQCDWLYLTICLDVFPAAVAPAVSAPAARGVAVEVIESLLEQVRDSGKLALADIAELNPKFDLDARTARLAARLIHSLSLLERRS